VIYLRISGNLHCGEEKGLNYLYFPQLAATGLLRHAFSTRRGGASAGEYSTLNLGLQVGDDRDCVIENRRRFCRALGTDLDSLVAARQEHTDNVAVVTAAERGCGAGDEATAIPSTDALITAEPGVVLSIYTADCVPVLLLDPRRRAFGLVHAGWRGTVAGIILKTLARMTAVFGTEPGDCLAGIGPSIGPCCYLVDEPVIRPLRERFSDWAELVRPAGPGQWRLDLWEANRRQLTAAGLLPVNVTVGGLCTACRTDLFFSHRAEKGRTGRQAAGARLL
jgi:YfiH family protein